MAGFNKIVLKANDTRIELDIETAQKLMMKLEEVLRVEHATIEFSNQPNNLNDWIYFPSGEAITLSLLHIPLIVNK